MIELIGSIEFIEVVKKLKLISLFLFFIGGCVITFFDFQLKKEITRKVFLTFLMFGMSTFMMLFAIETSGKIASIRKILNRQKTMYSYSTNNLLKEEAKLLKLEKHLKRLNLENLNKILLDKNKIDIDSLPEIEEEKSSFFPLFFFM